MDKNWIARFLFYFFLVVLDSFGLRGGQAVGRKAWANHPASGDPQMVEAKPGLLPRPPEQLIDVYNTHDSREASPRSGRTKLSRFQNLADMAAAVKAGRGNPLRHLTALKLEST